MKLAICDDDMDIRSDYVALVESIAEKHKIDIQVSEYASGNQLEFALAGPDEPPDIILLDVMMPGPDGITVAKRLRDAGFAGIIIYLTQSPDYMLPAFDVGAFNYVIKYSSEKNEARFEKVFIKAAEKVELSKKKYILLNGISEHRNLPIDSILYFESLKHLITVHYGEGEAFEFVSSLSRVEDALIAYGFVRIHRSYLVNSASIRTFDFKSATLTDGSTLPVGRKRYPELKTALRKNADVSLDDEE